MNEIEILENWIELKQQAMHIFVEEKLLEIAEIKKEIQRLKDDQI